LARHLGQLPDRVKDKGKGINQMGFTALPGSMIVFGAAPGTTNPQTLATTQTDYNTTDGPSLFNCGVMLMDMRKVFTYLPGSNYGGSSNAQPVYGWLGTTQIPVIDQIPTTISTNSVALNQPLVNNQTVVLSSVNTTNVTLTTIVAPESGATVNVWAIDGAMSPVTFGSDASIAVWDPTKAITRQITISTTGTDTGSWTIAGRDLYGIKLSETIAASTTGAANTLHSQKAYKYIQAITPTSTGTFGSSSVMVGVNDTYGLPLYVSNGAYASIWTDNALIVSSTNIIAGQSLSSVATSTTPDVRGVYVSSTASSTSAGVRTVMFLTPSVAAMNTTFLGDASHGVVGIVQFSSV
jgi:hypothetical protein